MLYLMYTNKKNSCHSTEIVSLKLNLPINLTTKKHFWSTEYILIEQSLSKKCNNFFFFFTVDVYAGKIVMEE